MVNGRNVAPVVICPSRVSSTNPITEASDTRPPLGLGWRVDRDARGRARWHHAGATPGGRCVLVIFPDEGLSVAFASNTMTVPGDVLGPAGELVDCFL